MPRIEDEAGFPGYASRNAVLQSDYAITIPKAVAKCTSWADGKGKDRLLDEEGGRLTAIPATDGGLQILHPKSTFALEILEAVEMVEDSVRNHLSGSHEYFSEDWYLDFRDLVSTSWGINASPNGNNLRLFLPADAARLGLLPLVPRRTRRVSDNQSSQGTDEAKVDAEVRVRVQADQDTLLVEPLTRRQFPAATGFAASINRLAAHRNDVLRVARLKVRLMIDGQDD